MKQVVKIAIAAAAIGAWLIAKKKAISGIGLAGDRTFRYVHTEKGYDVINAYEPYFGKDVVVGYVNHNRREIRPAHGYFYPHKYGKLMKKLANELGYVFNNN